MTMLSVNDSVELTVDDISFGGAGVGRTLEGQVVFVPFTAKGDVVTVRVTEAHKRFTRGTIEALLTASADRQEPACPYFGRCGGCVYQHLTYEAEFSAKQQQLDSVLSRIGGLNDIPEFDVAVASPTPIGYRNKLRLEPVLSEQDREEGYLPYGYCETDNRTFFIVDACPLGVEKLNELFPKGLRTKWGRRNARRERPHPMTVRIDAEGSTHCYFGRAPVKIPWLTEKLFRKDVRVPLGAFWQVNSAVFEQLAQSVRSWCEQSPTRWLIDAYAGVGTFSLAAGKAFAQRVAIENDASALQAAEHNLAQWGLSVTAVEGRTEDHLGKAFRRLNSSDTTLILDPPRTGCASRVIDVICQAKPAQILYVSCNASTLARDLKRLLDDGFYRLSRIGLFDMFPRTAHFESAVMLTSGSGS